MAPLGPFGTERRVTVAVSGGADSLCLALLARRWGTPNAAVVDHGIRAASANEADETMARLHAMGVPATLLRLRVQPGAGLGERARLARYAALLDHCSTVGTVDLLLGHHARDQAETVALRIARGSGPAGQAGMAAVTWRDKARLLRPLLGMQPARLRTTLEAAGLHWVEDPTNADPRTPRGAMRQPGTVLPTAPGAAERRHGTEAALAAELAACVTLHPAGFAEVKERLSADAWGHLVWVISGRVHPPGPGAGRRFAAGMDGTVHGVMKRGTWLAREPAAAGPPVPAVAGAVWDGRFLVERGVNGATIGALGAVDATWLRRRPGPPAAVLAGLPAVRLHGKLFAVPHMAYPDAETCLSVIVRFRPVSPLAGAPFGLARPEDC